MFSLVSTPRVRRSPVAIAASVGTHAAIFAAVIASAHLVTSNPPHAPHVDLTHTELTYIDVIPPEAPSVAMIPAEVPSPPVLLASTPEPVPAAPPLPAPRLERAAVQPAPEVVNRASPPAPSKPAPPVVVGVFASLAPAEPPRATNKQVASAAFDLEQTKSADLRTGHAAVGAFDQSVGKEPPSGSDRTRPLATGDAGFASPGSIRREGTQARNGSTASPASGGFDVARSPAAARRADPEPVQPTGFEAQPVKAAKPAAAQERTSVPVEVLFKPVPIYTQEARNLKIEGDVSLEVEFGASGKVKMLRVVSGLGHGLDEAASEAAEHIRFKPAQSGNTPIDFRAIVHITFRLT